MKKLPWRLRLDRLVGYHWVQCLHRLIVTSHGRRGLPKLGPRIWPQHLWRMALFLHVTRTGGGWAADQKICEWSILTSNLMIFLQWNAFSNGSSFSSQSWSGSTEVLSLCSWTCIAFLGRFHNSLCETHTNISNKQLQKATMFFWNIQQLLNLIFKKKFQKQLFAEKTTLTKFQEVLKNNFLQKKQFYKVSRSFKKKFRGENVEKIKCYIYIRYVSIIIT